MKEIAPDVRMIMKVCYAYKEDATVGEGKGFSQLYRKPNPGMLFSILEDLKDEPTECLFVGDSDDDMMCAMMAGFKIGVESRYLYLPVFWKGLK